MIRHTQNGDIYSRPRRDLVSTRIALVLAAGLPLMLTFLVPINRLIQVECPFLTITGLPCPFCGFTRSLWAISAGDWHYAMVNCPLAWLLYTWLVILFGYTAGSIIIGFKNSRPAILNLTRRRTNRIAVITTALILLNWLYRLSLGIT